MALSDQRRGPLWMLWPNWRDLVAISKREDALAGGARPQYHAALHNTTKTDDLPDAYARSLANGIRERFDLKSTPIRLQLRQTDNPFVETRE
jgi:KH-domain-like of EngA bacterial GTPase enzymes, C-terminal